MRVLALLVVLDFLGETCKSDPVVVEIDIKLLSLGPKVLCKLLE